VAFLTLTGSPQRLRRREVDHKGAETHAHRRGVGLSQGPVNLLTLTGLLFIRTYLLDGLSIEPGWVEHRTRSRSKSDACSTFWPEICGSVPTRHGKFLGLGEADFIAMAEVALPHRPFFGALN